MISMASMGLFSYSLSGELNLSSLYPFQKIFRSGDHLRLSFPGNALLQIMCTREAVRKDYICLYILRLFHSSSSHIPRKFWKEPPHSSSCSATERFPMVMLHLDPFASKAFQQVPCSIEGLKPPSQVAGVMISDHCRISL